MSNETPGSPEESDRSAAESEATAEEPREPDVDALPAAETESKPPTEQASVPGESLGADEEPASAADAEPVDDAGFRAEPDTVRIDEVPVDIGEPEPALDVTQTSGDVVTESVVGFVGNTTEYDDVVAVGEPYAGVGEPPQTVGEQPAPAIGPIYVTAPVPPRRKGNRLMGILIAVVASVAYAVVFAVVVLGIFALRDADGAVSLWENYLRMAGFWVPVAVFFLAEVLIIAIVNRAGWWAHGIGSFFVGVIVYFGYLAGALMTVSAWKLDSGQVGQFMGTLWSSPLTFASAVVALEASLWFGAWIAARGRRVRERNLDAQRDYDRRIEQGPTA